MDLIDRFMSNFTDTYEVTSSVTETGINFFFVSEGKKDVFKTIDYSYFLDHQGKKVYNLAFGDFDHRTGGFADNQATNNGDPYSVYHTVLATIPYFFRSYEEAWPAKGIVHLMYAERRIGGLRSIEII
jgi:hypothetical protein